MIMEDQVTDQFEAFPRFGAGFGDQNADAWELGGKGANLSKMAARGYNVPPGFIIPTALSPMFAEAPNAVMDAVMADLGPYLDWLRNHFGYMPLLSVRSGAPVSMPGMMDTILNVGMCREVLPDWKERLNERAAYDSYRRMLQMLGTTALNLDAKRFDTTFETVKKETKAHTDADMTVDALRSVCKRYWTIYSDAGLKTPPDDLLTQLRFAIGAVFKSWNSERAIHYRKMEGISEDMGTAVVVQAMVFGNMNDRSGSGVLFTRDPSTGEKVVLGEFLPNAQGEDVVAGIRTPLGLDEMAQDKDWEPIRHQLLDIAEKLELDARDMQDVEFTVQDGELFMLQTRNGKRTAKAAFRIAVDLAMEGMIERKEVYRRVTAKQYLLASRPVIDPKFKTPPWMKGIPASPGVVSGHVVTSAAAAVSAAKQGLKVILVTHETTPDDIAGMDAALGILTKTGGATSHAAVVARGMNKPCVVGCTDLNVDDPLLPGHMISINGSTGEVWKQEVPVAGGEEDEYLDQFFRWLFEDHGMIEKVVQPRANSCVMLAEWLHRTPAEIVTMVDTLKLLNDDGQLVILDATPADAYGDKPDAMIWNAMGVVPEQARFVQNVLAGVKGADLTKTYFVTDRDPIRDVLKKTMMEVPEALTLHSLLHVEGFVTVSDNLRAALGHGAQVKEVMDLVLGKNPKARLMPKPMFKGEAAFAVLKSA